MEVPPLSAMRALGWCWKWAIMHAECAGVSGPGYYATGFVEDVLGRLPKVESSPVCPAGHISNVGIVTGTDRHA